MTSEPIKPAVSAANSTVRTSLALGLCQPSIMDKPDQDVRFGPLRSECLGQWADGLASSEPMASLVPILTARSSSQHPLALTHFLQHPRVFCRRGRDSARGD